MPNRPGNDDRITAAGSSDRGGQQRDASGVGAHEGAPQNGSPGGAKARARSNRGFASMDSEKQKEIASKGGKAAHAKGTAHEFDSGEARAAGRKGGVAVSRNREHMAAIGRRGGEARGQSRTRRNATAETNHASPVNGASEMNGQNRSHQNSQNSGDHSTPNANRDRSNPSGGRPMNAAAPATGTRPTGGTSRPPSGSAAGGDRQVAINNEQEGVSASAQGTRVGNNALGGERRPSKPSSTLGSHDSTTRGETFGNH